MGLYVPLLEFNLIKELRLWVDAEYGRRSELARHLGVARQRVIDRLSGRKAPTLEQSFAILEILKATQKEKP